MRTRPLCSDDVAWLLDLAQNMGTKGVHLAFEDHQQSSQAPLRIRGDSALVTVRPSLALPVCDLHAALRNRAL